jgi:hypothetical protein
MISAHRTFLFLSFFLFWISSASEDIGQIGYFDRECPPGWEIYKPASGRFILGTGTGTNYTLGKTGGN